MLIKSLLFCLLVLGANTVFGERFVRILYHQAPENAPKSGFLYGSSGKFINVSFPRWNMSDKFTLPDNGEQFYFFPKKLADDMPIPANAPRVQINKTWDQAILLVIPDTENPILPIRLQSINASASVFGFGEIYWINLTDLAIGGLIGDRKLIIKPRSKLIMKTPKQTNGDYAVKVDYLIPGENRPKWLLRQTWSHNIYARQLVFINKSNQAEVPSLFSVVFYR